MKTKMKKLSCLLFAGMLMTNTGCSSRESAASLQEAENSSLQSDARPDAETADSLSEQTEETSDASETKASDILVVYFSRTVEQYTVGVIDKGNTAIVAEMIAERTGADLFEILPADDHYPTTYNELTDVAKKEQIDNARPAYADDVPDLAAYDTIFIGSPVWWGDWPMIMYTFFEENVSALSGKTLVPFSTHEGSGLAGFDRKLASACPDSTILKGLANRGNDCQNRQDSVRKAVNGWLDELGY